MRYETQQSLLELAIAVVLFAFITGVVYALYH
jgi:hypothetical protein